MKSTSSLCPVSLFSQSGSAPYFRRTSARGLQCEVDPLCQSFWQQPAQEEKDFIRSQELSRVRSGQYLDRRLVGNTRCCRLGT